MNHLSLKISACVVGVALWFFVSLSREYQREYTFPLLFDNLPENLALEHLPPDTIRLRVEGTGWDLISIDPLKLPIKLNLSHATLGDTSIVITPKLLENQTLNFQLTVVQVLSPRNLSLTIEPKLNRKSPVQLDVEVLPAEGYVVVNELQSDPVSIEISGGRREIARTLNIPTIPFRINGLRKDTTLNIPLSNPSPQGLSLHRNSIQVHLEVQKLGTRTFENFPVSLIPPDRRGTFKLSPETATLTLRGGQKNLDKITPTELYLFIENSRFEIEGKTQLAPSLRYPAAVLNYSVQPETFTRLHLQGDSLHDLSGN